MADEECADLSQRSRADRVRFLENFVAGSGERNQTAFLRDGAEEFLAAGFHDLVVSGLQDKHGYFDERAVGSGHETSADALENPVHGLSGEKELGMIGEDPHIVFKTCARMSDGVPLEGNLRWIVVTDARDIFGVFADSGERGQFDRRQPLGTTEIDLEHR